MKVIPLSTGQLFRDACFDLIDLASGDDEIIANYFVIRKDQLGISFCHKIFQAACRGVKVTLIVDSYGSLLASSEGTEYLAPPLDDSILNSLAMVGVIIFIYHPVESSKMWSWSNLSNWSNFTRRNHNKNLVFNLRSKGLRGLVIGDGQWANEHFNGQMKGSNIFIESPKVYIQGYCYQQKLIHSSHVTPYKPSAFFSSKDSCFQVLDNEFEKFKTLESSTWYHSEKCYYPDDIDFVASEIEFVKPVLRHTIQDYELELLKQSSHSVEYCTPYFSPDEHLQRALIEAGHKLGDKLNIRIGKFRHDPYLPYGVRKVVKNLLKYDLKIYEYTGVGNIHYKDMVVDNTTFIKTANGEGRSRFYNLETGVMIHDAKLAVRIKDFIHSDFQLGQELSSKTSYLNQHPWWQRPAKAMLCPLYFHHL